MTASDPRSREVQRLLRRYMIEVVERFDVCPWARQARRSDAVATAILWGIPTLNDWVSCSSNLLASSHAHVVMIVAPELACVPSELRRIRDDVAARIATAGVADFHPDAALDLATPPRLVPYLRRSPDPMLQLVPLTRLEAARGLPDPAVGRPVQAQMLSGAATPCPIPVADRIAQLNHAHVLRDPHSIAAALADIRADRDRTYARLHIGIQKPV